MYYFLNRKIPFAYAAPFRNLKNMKTPYDWANVDSTMHRAFIKLMTINTLRRPNASASEPQMYAPAIMPRIFGEKKIK